MKTINVEGVPEQIAQALQLMVDALRRQALTTTPSQKPQAPLPRWPGKVIGDLRREDLYADVR